MELLDKLKILADSAKFDVACTSSGVDKPGKKGMLGNAVSGGICHAFGKDGRCISLLKVLMTNYCVYDCSYCQNRVSNDLPRAAFTPKELAELTIGFYRRNYIEGLFLSSGVVKSPDHTMELMIKTLEILREEYRFNGYIHSKVIPGASQPLVTRLGALSDRLSVNMELPSEQSLAMLAPDKTRKAIFRPMAQIRNGIKENTTDLVKYNHTPDFAPAGQSTQMIIGATADTDYQIIRLAQGLYNKYELKRVFYSGYIPISTNALLPQNQAVPKLREHRLYQADWLLRFYGFSADEILSEKHPNLDPNLDPKCNWAINHLELFPIEVNTADLEMLLRVPGIGPTTARRIVKARKTAKLSFDNLKKMRVVMRRCVHFITCSGKMYPGAKLERDYIYYNLLADYSAGYGTPLIEPPQQLTLFAPAQNMLTGSKEVYF